MPTPVDAPKQRITSDDPGMAAIQLAMHTDRSHVDRLNKVSNELTQLGTMLQKHTHLKRQLEAVNDGKGESHDLSGFYERLQSFENEYNSRLGVGESKINLNLYKLDNKSSRDVKAIISQIDSKLNALSQDSTEKTKLTDLKKSLEEKLKSRATDYDVTELYESLRAFQDFYNEHIAEGEEKIDLNLMKKENREALKGRTSKELEQITKYIEDVVEELKFKTSEKSTEVYKLGHLYTIVMQIFQELVRTENRGKDRLAQASRSH